MNSLFEQLGGENALREIVDTFVDKVFADRMIGFFFRKANKQRIKLMEYQLAAHFLGAGTPYEGQSLERVHAKHPIMGGHFARRRQILKETLEFYNAPEAVKQAWLKHTDDMRPLITDQNGSGCDAEGARRRAINAGA